MDSVPIVPGVGFFPCQVPLCTSVSESNTALLSHYRVVHREDATFSVPCLIPGCSHTANFKTETALRKHLEKYDCKNDKQSSKESGTDKEAPTSPLGRQNEEQHDTIEEAVEENQTSSILDPALYVLQLLEKRKLTQVDLQAIMKMTNVLVNQSVASTLAEAVQSLNDEGYQKSATLENMIKIYSTPHTAPNVFDGLATQYSQRKCFAERFGLISPVVERLEKRIEDFGRHRTGKSQSQKRQSYVRVPLIPQLEYFLNLDGVFVELSKRKPRREGVLSNFEDGIAFKENALFCRHSPCSLLGSVDVTDTSVGYRSCSFHVKFHLPTSLQCL